jgi:hypothetical protein
MAVFNIMLQCIFVREIQCCRTAIYLFLVELVNLSQYRYSTVQCTHRHRGQTNLKLRQIDNPDL